MHRLIGFLHGLIDTETTSNKFNETAQWSLMRDLEEFEWRIPSIWRDMIERAKVLLDHPSPDVRERIAK